MANGIIILDSTKSNLEGRIVWESSANGAEANSSYVAGHLQVRRNDGYTTKGTWSGAMNIGGTVNTFSEASTSVSSDWVTMLEFYITKLHNDDGTGSCYFEAYCDAPSGTSMAGQRVFGNTTVTLDTIPRYAHFSKHEFNSKTVNSANILYKIDRDITAAQYSLRWSMDRFKYCIRNVE